MIPSHIKGIGALTLLEVYDYFDGPKLYACQNATGQIFLVLWVEAEETHDRWFYLPIGMNRLTQVRSGLLPLRKAVVESEDGWLWEVITAHDGAQVLTKAVETTAISDEDLPDPDALIQCGGPLSPPPSEAAAPVPDTLEIVLDTHRSDHPASTAVPSHRSWRPSRN